MLKVHSRIIKTHHRMWLQFFDVCYTFFLRCCHTFSNVPHTKVARFELHQQVGKCMGGMVPYLPYTFHTRMENRRVHKIYTSHTKFPIPSHSPFTISHTIYCTGHTIEMIVNGIALTMVHQK